ncbi:MAG: hypothetical protein ACNS60_02255 [Candidatus Cyclobacteriaceae bacterium M2_1C_046]
MIDGEYFYPKVFNVPCIEVYDFDPELDHQWYEFEKISETDEPFTDNRTIIDFISEIEKMESLTLRQG